jgi:hypothetical protein
MGRNEPISMDAATGKARELLDELASRGGEPGPMVRAMANAPALLRGYLDLNRAMKRSHLDRRISERIALAVHEWLDCDYQVGSALGLAVMTAIATSQGADQLGNLTALTDGYQAAVIGAAVIAAAGALLAAVLLRIPKAVAAAAEPVEEQERVAA